ncbi:MAG: ABC transporter permease [Clostridiales bacterium]|nr:ABC transporter permease [Clostridiales bacterium]
MMKITQRAELPKGREWAIRAAAVLLSIVFAGTVIAALGFDPIKVFAQIVNGSVGSQMRLNQTILKAIPLTITSMGILVAFKMKFWNIGGEGQIMMGAMGATYAALHLPPDLPPTAMLAMLAAASVICGGAWAFIPAYFKAKFGTNETIFTLMMNYIAIKWVTYLQYDLWKDPGSLGFPRIAAFPPSAVLPKLFGIHVGWIVAVLSVVLVYIFVNHTKKGYEVTVIGESVETARYAGMNIKHVMIAAMLVSGGLCGLTGMVQASAVEKTLTYSLSANYGFTAIITTWLGRLSAPAVAIVCFAFAMLIQGGAYLQIALLIPASVAEMIQGIILFFVLGSEFFIQYRVSFSRRAARGVA